MGQVRHGCATTTPAVRAAIQRSHASLATLSREFGSEEGQRTIQWSVYPTNAKTVVNWRERSSVEDLKAGRAAVIRAERVAFRRHTLLPLEDCLYALQPSIPHLTRSALHRCLQRHGISRLPDVEGDKPKRQQFKRYPIGFFHIDIAEVQTVEGKLPLSVAVDRTSTFAVVQLVGKADDALRGSSRSMCPKRALPNPHYPDPLPGHPCVMPCRAMDNGIQFAGQPRNRNTVYSRPMRFDMICEGETLSGRPWMRHWFEHHWRRSGDNGRAGSSTG